MSMMLRCLLKEKIENFYAEYPIGFIMELYRQDLLEKAFVLPAIVPN